MKTWFKLFVVLFIVGGLAGCARTVAIEQVQGTVSAGHTIEQVKNAILKAGHGREWIMEDTGFGVINATMKARTHMVEVRINYSATRYSITYTTSKNMKASNGKIHPTYNRWIRNLDKAIQLNLYNPI
ncbi:MAG: hypothetical protein ACRC5A_03970 [Enterobacteriaceae bacterium]